MLIREREIDHIGTVSELRDALAEAPDDMPIGDVFGEPLLVTFWRDKETGDQSIEIG